MKNISGFIRNYSTIISLLLAVLVPSATFAQDSTHAKKKFLPFVYNSTESPATFDIGVSTGLNSAGAGNSPGLGLGFRAQIDFYHILAGYGFNYTSLENHKYISVGSIHLGYRYRSKRIMAAVMSGFSTQKFRCYGGDSYDCYEFEDEVISATPLEIQLDYIISNSFAVGIQFHHLFSDRQDITGVMVGFKMGALQKFKRH